MVFIVQYYSQVGITFAVGSKKLQNGFRDIWHIISIFYVLKSAKIYRSETIIDFGNIFAFWSPSEISSHMQ